MSSFSSFISTLSYSVKRICTLLKLEKYWWNIVCIYRETALEWFATIQYEVSLTMALTKHSLTSKEVLFSLTHFNSSILLSNDAVNSIIVFLYWISLSWPPLTRYPSIPNLCLPWTQRKGWESLGVGYFSFLLLP